MMKATPTRQSARQSDRLRRKSEIQEINGDPSPVTSPDKEDVTVKNSRPPAERILRARPSRHDRSDIDLMMECEDDVLTSPQLLALKRAKDEYDKVMAQIKAAREGRLLFGQPAGQAVQPGKVTIMSSPAGRSPVVAQPEVIVLDGDSPRTTGQKQVPSPLQTGRQIMIANRPGFPPQVVRFVSPPGQPAPTSAQLAQLAQLANQGSPGSRPMLQLMQPGNQRVPILQQSIMPNSIPVQRVPAQPRKPDTPVQKSMEVISGTYGLGIKRTYGQEYLQQTGFPPYKKLKRKENIETDDQGNWVPLDEYYYGKREGDPGYVEERGEFRFKCWYCNKMLYNNVKTMMHIQSHIDSDKQQNLDLSDLTQCKHCYKQFDTPFEMQTHIEKVHLSNTSVLMCRICEKDHDTRNALTSHMRQNHNSCEMPYLCHLCNFRSSMYGDVVDHFKKKHDSSPHMLCLYCLKVFKVQFVSNGWGKTQNFYHHLVKHQGKVRSKKCSSCKLTFFNPQEVKLHKKKDHMPNQKGILIGGINTDRNLTSEQVMIKVSGFSNPSSAVKSLNAPAVTKLLDLSRLRIPLYAASNHCFECKGSIANPDHFKKYTECSMCRFATSCSSAYANHMMSFHSGRAPVSIYLTIPVERPMEKRRYCLCGFSSRFGNKIANHMVFCMKRTCYSQRVENIPMFVESFEEREVDPRRRPGASILDALGLVKKQTAKRSSVKQKDVVDLEASRIMELVSRQVLLAQFEQEALTADEENVNNASDEELLDFDVEEEVDSDDAEDADYRPGRFSRPPKGAGRHKRNSGGSMLVKLNFNKSKTPKKTKVEEIVVYPSPGATSAGSSSATEGTVKVEEKSSAAAVSGSADSNSASKDSITADSKNKETEAEIEQSEEGTSQSKDPSEADVSEASNQSELSKEKPGQSESAVKDSAAKEETEEEKKSDDLAADEEGNVKLVDEKSSDIIDEDKLLKEPSGEEGDEDDVNEDELLEDGEKKGEGDVGREATPEDAVLEKAEDPETKDKGNVEREETTDDMGEAEATEESGTAEKMEEESSDNILEEENLLKDAGDEEKGDDDGNEDELLKDSEKKGEGDVGREATPEDPAPENAEEHMEDKTSEQEVEEVEDPEEIMEEESVKAVEDDNKEIPKDKSAEPDETPMEDEDPGDETPVLKPTEETNIASPPTPTQDEAMETEDVPSSIPEESSKGDDSAASPTENVKDFPDAKEQKPEGINELSTGEITSGESLPVTSEEPSLPTSGTSQKSEARQGLDSADPSGGDDEPTGSQGDLPEKQLSEQERTETKKAPSDTTSEHGSEKRSRWDESSDAGKSSVESSGDRRGSGGNDSSKQGSSGSYDQRQRQSSGYDRSPEKRYSSSGSHHRSHDSDRYGNRHSRDDKYRSDRDRGSGRYDDRGHSGRDYDRRDDRGYSSRDHGNRSSGDRYHDNRYQDDRHQDRGYRRDSDYQDQGNRGRGGRGGGSGYYGNQRKDYY